MITLKCTDCQHEIECEPSEPGEIVECENCGAEFLITNIKPLQFEHLDQEK